MPKILSWLQRHFDFLFLVLTLLFIFVKNYTPGTYLIGWDNLMPELNIWLNLKRSFLAVWQQHQGLGLVGGNAHATELIRIVMILPFSLILPTDLIRYLWHFSMLALGSFGLLFGLKKYFKFPSWISLLGSLFYLLNFGSIQNFWIPFEPFSAFWGFFPWLIFSLWDYLKSPTKSKLIKLLILNLLAIPSFFIPTIFIVYLLCLSLVLLSHLFINFKNWKLEITRSVKIILLILILNSFWLMPFVYFVRNDISNPRNSFANIMASGETLDRNLKRGTIPDFLLLRGFYYDYQNNGAYLLSPWFSHFSNNYFLISGYLLSVTVLIGLIAILINRKKNSVELLTIVLFFFLSALALLSATPPFSFLNTLIRQSPLLDQIFRAPFTKFITPAVFSFSLLFAFSLKFLFDYLSSLKYSPKKLILIFTAVYLVFIFSFSFPVFQGNYFSPKIRLNLPNSYTDLFTYFKSQPETARIANLPSGNFWGWTNYLWGYSGSGFLWFGLPQPVLDRTFDVWNLKNEDYYWELDFAIQNRSSQMLDTVFKKYSVEYVLFDNNIYFPADKNFSKNSTPSLELLSQIPDLKLVKSFDNILVFQYSNPSQPYLTSENEPTNSPFYLSSKRLPSEFKTNPITFPLTFDTTNALYDKNLLTSNHTPLISPYQYYISNGSYFRLSDYDSYHLVSWHFPEIGFNQSYLLKVETRHISGQPLRFSAFQENNLFKFFETKFSKNEDWQTSWFLIPKMENENFSPGLVLLLQNPSFDYSPTINDIRSIKLYPYPYIPIIETPTIKTNVKSRSNIFFYQININTPYSEKNLVLPQSYETGWLAFYFDNFKIKFLDHYQINNWANGWLVTPKLSNEGGNITIYLLFWPQLLEFLGFGLLIGSFIWLLKHRLS